MRRSTYLSILLSLFTSIGIVKAQAGPSNGQCVNQYNLFKGDYQTKRYQDAKKKLFWLMTNCPKLSVNVYIYGDRVAKQLKDNDLVKRIYDQRLINFPNKDVARAHGNYATFLFKNKLADDNYIFSILEKAYKADPTKMGVVNIYKYFQGVTDRNKDTNPQKVFDTYDDLMEAIQDRIGYYDKKIGKLKEQETADGSLDNRDKRFLRSYTINSKALGQVESGLNNIIISISTCPRLVALYKKEFEQNKNDAKWLRRAVSRLYKKSCQSDPLYEKLARAYAEVSKSANAYSFLAVILDKNGESDKASQMRLKAFELETDPNKKALYKLKFAQQAKSKGQKAKARSLARQALKYNPNLGRAYLFIASLYASSANHCGTNEFEKRMVYVAALNQVRKAIAVAPSLSKRASVYIRSYRANMPSKKMIFKQGIASGTPYKIKCWIGETVKVP